LTHAVTKPAMSPFLQGYGWQDSVPAALSSAHAWHTDAYNSKLQQFISL